MTSDASDDLDLDDRDIALLQRVGSGQAGPDEPGIDGLVQRALVEVTTKRGPHATKVPCVNLLAAGRTALRTERGRGKAFGVRKPLLGKGRCVLYAPAPFKERAAMIVDVLKGPGEKTNLVVFGTGMDDPRLVGNGIPLSLEGQYPVRLFCGIPYSADVSKPGTWHWLGDGVGAKSKDGVTDAVPSPNSEA
jgi:hypothetical protein